MKKPVSVGIALLFSTLGLSVGSSTGFATEVIWSDDAVPAGAVQLSGGDSWNWISSNPTPAFGSVAHQSDLAAGLHEHFFNYAGTTLTPAVGDVLYTYVYLDPANIPSEIMLSWNSNGWEHRAYWGANSITYGNDGSASRHPMGAMPAAGQWVRLEVPASSVGLEAQTIVGMGFSEFDGRATWDKTGTSSTATTEPVAASPLPSSVSETVWMDDAVPAGAVALNDGKDSWKWVGASPAPVSGTLAHQSANLAGLHEHFFNYASATITPGTGDLLFAYVYLDPASTPSEIMLSWNANGWEHRAYWGADSINYGTGGAASRHPMGAMPAAGQWIRLEVPASAVGLEGQAITGMGFSQFDGLATWDKAGSETASANAGGTVATTPPVTTPPVTTPPATTTPVTTPPVTTPPTTTPPTTTPPTDPAVAAALRMYNIDGTSLQLAQVGDTLLHVLSPTLLELKLINTKAAGATQVSAWNFVDASGNFAAPSGSKISVTVNGQTVAVTAMGFKRRVAYAPLATYDLRVENSLYLQLGSVITTDQAVQVTNPDGSLWAASQTFSAVAGANRYSPAIHVNQEGYVPSLPKKAMIGYFLGDLGEMDVPASTGFTLVDARSGASVYSGALTVRQDVGYNTSPLPYQKVLVADFSSFQTPGEYQLQVAGLGASLPFVIDDGIAMNFTRTYALGMYHQRSGISEGLPFTRFAHGADHTAPALVPVQSDPQFTFTWNCIASYGGVQGADNPTQIAPRLVSEATQLYPFVNKGSIDVAGGHWDAGDYSKYTSNSAELIHYLMFTADTVPGANKLDNLGLPESGDGISDIMQEAKIEADYISKIQDADGGFYFLVYPKNREYESGTPPDQGDQQVVWPKNTSVTAAAVAALAQCASSPQFKQQYPAVAAKYLQQAKLGWQFLMNAVAKYGKAGAYQKITFYSDHWTHDDELAWAACEMFLATGEAQYSAKLAEYFPNPADSNTFRWGWWRMSECWGNAIRSYAFAARTGRLPASALDPIYLAACEAQIVAAGDDVVDWSTKNAYATPFPTATKAVQGAGWYFSLDQASDVVAAYQISPKPAYIDVLVGAMNYEGGTNPVNVTYLTGIGLKRQHEIVSQYAQSDRRVMPETGIPLGNIQAAFDYLQNYGSTLSSLSYPSDNRATGQYPFYDRWSDTFNVTTELVTVNQARSILSTSFLATRTASASRAWTSAPAQIVVPASVAPLGVPVSLTVSVPGQDLTGARIVWEARDQDPAFGATYTIAPKNNGTQWVEVEIAWPDGRRSFGGSTFSANSPVVTWVENAIPTGGSPGADGGDGWNWTATPAPQLGSQVHQSNLAAGLHEHWFAGASATMDVATGDTLYAWVYLDPVNTPSEVMLMWNDSNGWEHRATWGADRITYGTLGTASRYHVGNLPVAGQWVKLTVPASAVGLEGKTLSGMGFSTFDGRSTWDAAGKAQ